MTSLAPLFSLNCLLRGSGINEKCKKVCADDKEIIDLKI